jgi:hypothetical protein
MKIQLSAKDWQLLSEYLDEQLSAADRVRLEQGLQNRAELRSGLEELRRTRAVLRAAPRRKVPHNFTLTHAMAAEAARPRLSGWFPAMRLTSALAALMFILVLFLQNSSLAQSTSALPAAAPAMEKAMPQIAAGAANNDQASGTTASETTAANGTSASSDAAASATPMILLWGQQNYGQPQAKGMGGGGSDGFGGTEPLTQGSAPEAASGAASQAGSGAAADTAQNSSEQPNAGVLSAPMAATEAPSEPGFAAQATSAPTQAEEAAQPAEPSTGSRMATAPAAAAVSATLAPDVLATPLTGNGPIVGVAPESERGMMAVTESQSIPQNLETSRRARLNISWTVIETVLGAVALGAGGVAVWLWRRSRA